MLRRHIWRWISVAALASIAAAAAAPAGASAATTGGITYEESLRGPCPVYAYSNTAGVSLDRRCTPATPQYRTANLRYVGWTYLNLNYCEPNRACALSYRVSMDAWRWTGSRWVAAALPQGWVYVSPYSGEWRWAWTQRTGWVAVSGGRFEIR